MRDPRLLPETLFEVSTLKNSSALGALVLIGLAIGVGVMALQTEQEDINADLVEAASPARKASFTQDLSPQEARKKGNLEAAKRYLAKVREEGVNVGGDLWRIKDDDGTPLYVTGHLIEGFDAFGEPKYLIQKTKRQAAVPRNDRLKAKLPEHMQPKIAKKKIQIEFSEKSDNGKGRMNKKKAGGKGGGEGEGDEGGGSGGGTATEGVGGGKK